MLKTASGLRAHKRTMHAPPVACPRGCGEQVRPANLRKHLKQVHNSVTPAKVACRHCNKLVVAQGLGAHERSHTDARPFKCRFCGQAFKQSGHCANHEDSLHLFRRFFCLASPGTCTQSFTTTNGAKYHLRTDHNIGAKESPSFYEQRDTDQTAAVLAAESISFSFKPSKRQCTRTPSPKATTKPPQADQYGENGDEIESIS